MIIPERYKHGTYADVPQNIKDCFEKLKDTRQGLYLYGSVGCGKTHIAYELVKATIMTLREKHLFWNVSELLREIRKDYDRKEKQCLEEKLMEFEGVLFLDDLGSEKISEWVEEVFYLIINKRYNDMRPTIYTSNLSLGEIADRVGDRIASRIAGSCSVIKIEGGDRRLNKK
jgi:DNA replication protein DnaC